MGRHGFALDVFGDTPTGNHDGPPSTSFWRRQPPRPGLDCKPPGIRQTSPMPSKSKRVISRRAALAGLGTLGAAMFGLDGQTAPALESPARSTTARSADARSTIRDTVFKTMLVDTHEHLVEEPGRLQGAASPARTLRRLGPALQPLPELGSPGGRHAQSAWISSFRQRLTRRTSGGCSRRIGRPSRIPAMAKPCGWPFVSSMAWGNFPRQPSARFIRLRADPAPRVLSPHPPGPRRDRVLSGQRPGPAPFRESDMPPLLMQDISIVGMFAGPAINSMPSRPALRSRGLRTGIGLSVGGSTATRATPSP